MALSIGELVGYLKIDDAGVDEGLSRSEQRIKGFGLAAKALGGAAGAGLGAGFGVAAETAMQLDGMTGKLQAQLGISAQESERIGGVAGNLYANAYGENLAEVGDAITVVMREVDGMSRATDAELEAVTGQMMSLAQVMEVDVGQAATAVGQMIRNGMAKDATEAMDLLTAGAQTGANRMGDLADVFSEYGETFQTAGMDGATAMGVMSQAMSAGAWSSDLVADSIREFGIIAQSGTTSAADAFKALGLDAKTMADDVAAGGDRSVGAMDKTLDALRAMPPSGERAALAVALFGTKAEEMGDSLLAIDPSTAVAGLGNVAGASATADAALGDLAANSIVSMQREAELLGAKLITTEGPLGTLAAGAAAFGPQALAMAGSMGMVVMGMGPLIASMAAGAASATTTAAAWIAAKATMIAQGAVQVAVLVAQGAVWVASVIAQGVAALASMAVTAAGYLASWVIMAAGAMISAVSMAAAWFIALGPIGWVIAAIVALVALVIANWDTVKTWTVAAWGAVSAAVGAAWDWIKGAVSAAAAWVVGLVTGAWESVSSATSGAWSAVTGAVGAAWDFLTGLVSSAAAAVVSFLSNAWSSAVSLASDAWSNIVSAVSSGASSVMSFVGSLPGQILGALGNLGSLLWSAGSDLVRGLWNGISAMGAWLMSRITGWIRSVVPGPILSFLGIASPSKWMRDEVGKWIPEGLAGGILANARVAGDAARDMAQRTGEAAREGAMASVAAAVPQVSAIGQAAQEILGRLTSGKGMFEDLTWKGASAAVGQYNDPLLDRMEADGVQSGGQRAWLEKFIASQTSGGGVTVNVHNPLPETASDSINRRARTVAALGGV